MRGDEVEQAYEGGADVLSGVRQPITAYAQEHGLTVLEPAFQAIRQAVAVPRERPARLVAGLDEIVAELKASGFVAESLERAGQVATVPQD